MSESKKKFPWLQLLAVSLAYGVIWNPIYINYILYDPMIAAMNITNMQFSAIVSVRVIINMIAMIPGGWICDKFSTRTILAGATILYLPLTIINAFTVSNYTMQMITFTVMGLVTTLGFWPATLKAIRIIGGKEHQSTSYGIFECIQGFFATIGNSIATLVFGWFVNQVAGYQAAMISMGVVSAVSGVIVWFLYKEPKHTEEEKEKENDQKFNIKLTFELLKYPEVWLCSVLIFAVMGFYNNQTYTTPYFTGVLGIAISSSAFIAIFRDYGAKIGGGPIGGFIAQKMGSPTLINTICLIICGTLFFLVPRATSGETMAVAIILIAALFGCVAKSTMWATMDEAEIPLYLTGTAVGIISLLGNSVPNLVFPLINGYLLDIYADNLQIGYNYYFTIIFVVCLVGAFSGILLLIRKKKRQKKA